VDRRTVTREDISTFQAYCQWMKKELDVSLADDKYELQYLQATGKIQYDIKNSDFWNHLKNDLIDANYQYKKSHKLENLLQNPDSFPTPIIKEYDRFLDKTWRKNVILNPNFPNPPKDGWITPLNWFSQINDVIRTSFVVNYLDGVLGVVKVIEQNCPDKDKFHCDMEAKWQGYYAAHCYVRDLFEIPGFSTKSQRVEIQLEIQVRTQLHEAINQLTHRFYELKWSNINEIDKKWQWDYNSQEFKPNYLGHILQYADGLIMEIRERGTDE
jgi:ppGpp synthetase/RelA/SpoT-type nucleotidyltranferase